MGIPIGYHDFMLTFRPANLADNEFIKSVFAAALPLYQELMPGSFEANLLNIDILTEKGLDFNATGLDGWILMSNLGLTEKAAVQRPGQALGFAGIGPLNPQQVYMAALYLLPEYQQQGYGSIALKQLEADYRAQNFSEMLLLVHGKADWALHFYTRAGYRRISDRDAEMVAYGGERFLYLYEPGLILMGKEL